MNQPFCPHVGALDADGRRNDATPYPSFENRCFVVHLVDPAADGLESGDQLLLRDQATYCLGESHRLCPRFRLVQRAGGGPLPAGEGGEALGAPLADDFDLTDEGSPRRLGMLAGLGALLLALFLCGGSLAAYAGWQLVGRGIVTLSQRVEIAPEQAEAGQVIILVTATLPPATPAPANAAQVAAPTPTPTFDFPQAVTATPENPTLTGPVVITTPTPQGQPPSAQADEPGVGPELATAVAGALVITQPGDTPATPTRRPTPVFVVPTSTPGQPLVGGVAATATPVALLPTVNFRAANQSILPGACTILSWDVENARAVFLDGGGVAGRGERQVCQRWTSQIYALKVLRLDGSEETHTVTVELVPHTVTPTVTPTNTPVLTPTPTWTPEGTPSATPIPPSFGVSVTVDGGNQKECVVGQRCDVALVVENTGSLADEMFVNLGKSGPWAAVICRDDGNCGDTALSVAIGPGQRRLLTLRVEIPGDAVGQSFNYQIEALSGNSGRTVSSGQTHLTITAR